MFTAIEKPEIGETKQENTIVVLILSTSKCISKNLLIRLSQILFKKFFNSVFNAVGSSHVFATGNPKNPRENEERDLIVPEIQTEFLSCQRKKQEEL